MNDSFFNQTYQISESCFGEVTVVLAGLNFISWGEEPTHKAKVLIINIGEEKKQPINQPTHKSYSAYN